jgi:hypothetical protein
MAQTQPDFSGTWTMDVKRSGSPTQEGFVGPVVWTIRQSPAGFLLDRKRGDKTAGTAGTWYFNPMPFCPMSVHVSSIRSNTPAPLG